MNKLLLIEDDTELAQLTRDYLQNHGFTVTIEADGGKAVSCIIKQQPDLVILDIMLPNKDGFRICREVREHASKAYTGPILMLTARDEDMDQLYGLQLGADDYVNKPAKPPLLLARIHALLRRSQPTNGSVTHATSLDFDELQIDTRCREVRVNNQAIALSTAEFNLLQLLAEYAGTVLSRDDILLHLRGIDYDGTDRSIDLRVSRLRQKLGHKNLIKTVRGKGYLFAAKPKMSNSSC